MSLTKVQIISAAITLMGKKPILSLDQQSDIVTAAEQAFDYLLPAQLSSGFWRFATTIAPLSQLNFTPVPNFAWAYAFELPGDYLKMVRILPQNWDFEIFEHHVMYTNVTGPLYIEYVRMVDDIAQLPDYFSNWLIKAIAVELCLTSANSASYLSALKPERDFLLAVAMANDAQNRPQTPLISQPILQNRFVTTIASG